MRGGSPGRYKLAQIALLRPPRRLAPRPRQRRRALPWHARRRWHLLDGELARTVGSGECRRRPAARSLDDERRRNPNLGRGRFSAPNETFTQIIQSELTAPKTYGDEGRAKNFAGVLSRAIATYELNAQVINGTLPRNGTTLSMRL